MHKTFAAIAIAASLSLGLSSNAWAENNSMNQSSSMTNAASINPDEYMNWEVVTANGNFVGTISNLVTNKQNHEVYAVVGVGGFMGIGVDEIAIPIDKLQTRNKAWKLSKGITKNSLEQGNKYEESEFSALEMRNDPGID
jgi:orotate phosphoribosyltransferase-like protein